MTKLFFILFLLSTSLYASSGNEVGNGGDALVCQTPDKKVLVHLFDFFEYQNQHGEKIEEKEGDFKSIVASIVDQLKINDPKLAQLLKSRSERFLSDSQFVTTAKLTDIKDANSMMKAPNKNCQIEQVAILKKKVLSNEKKFLISEILWDKMSETHKAGLVLHELIYEYFADLRETNSVNARAINAYLFSKNFSKVTSDDYWKMIRSTRVPHYK